MLQRTTVSRQAHSWGHCGRGRQPTSSWPREEGMTCWSVRDVVSLGKSLGPSGQHLSSDTALATSTASFYCTPLANTNGSEDFWSSFQIKTDLKKPLSCIRPKVPPGRGGPLLECPILPGTVPSFSPCNAVTPGDTLATWSTQCGTWPTQLRRLMDDEGR